MSERPEEQCPRCKRNAWMDDAGFGTFEPHYICGFCGYEPKDVDQCLTKTTKST